MRRYAVVVWLVVAPALAQDKAATAATLTAVKKDLAAGEFERALKKIDAALKKTTDPADAALLHLARGQALLAVGKADKAKAAFAAAIQKDPTVELDAARASPDAVHVFEQARAGFPATVSVKVRDGDAIITLDDKDMGPAPLQLELVPGRHVVDATAADGRRVKKELQVIPGRKLEVELELGEVKKPEPPPPPPPPLVTDTAPPRSRLGLVPLVAGGVVTVTGAVCLWQAGVLHDRLVNPSLPALTPDEQQAAAGTGRTLQTLGWVGLGVGVAAAATGAVLLALPARATPAADAPAVSLFFAPDGSVWVGVRGRLP